MAETTPKEKAEALVKEGVVGSWDEAVHMLVDMGEIDSTTHEEMLSEEERRKCYGA